MYKQEYRNVWKTEDWLFLPYFESELRNLSQDSNFKTGDKNDTSNSWKQFAPSFLMDTNLHPKSLPSS